MFFFIAFFNFYSEFNEIHNILPARNLFFRPDYNAREVKSSWNWNFVGPEGGEIIRIIGNPNVQNWCYGISISDLWVSYDNGNTWSYDPYFYLKINGMQGSDGIIISDMIGIIATNDTVYRTTDKGFSWTPVKGFNTLLAISSETPDTLIYAADINYPYFRVWRSNDKGLNWNLQGNITPIIIDNCDLALIAHRKDNPNYVRALIEYHNGNLVIIVGSTDGGLSWAIYDTIPGSDARDFQINPYNTNHSFITNTNGLFEATSYTGPWNQVITAMIDSIFQPYDVEFISSSNILVSSMFKQGIFKGTQIFTVWDFESVENREVCTGLAKSGNFFFSGTFGLGILKSINGTNWEFVNNGIFANIIFSKGNLSSLHDSSFYFAQAGGLLRKTKDYGANWEKLKNVTLFGGAVEYSPNDPNFILFSGLDVIGGNIYGPIYYSLYRSLNGGNSWVVLDSTYLLGDILIPYKDSIALGITTTMFDGPSVLYRSHKKGEGLYQVLTPSNNLEYNLSGLDSIIFVASDESLYISLDYGEHWLNQNGNGSISYDRTRRIFYIGSFTDTLIRYNVSTMHIDKIAPNIGYIFDHSVSPNGILYAISYLPGNIPVIGKSIDSGETFIVDTLPFYGGYFVLAGDSAVFIYQMGKGFYVSKDITTGIPESKKDKILFNRIVDNLINIELNIENYSYISMDVYDLTGRKIEELLKNKSFSPGKHTLSYKCTYNKGIYFLMITINEKTFIHKFIKI